MGPQPAYELPVVPERPLASATEALPQALPVRPVVAEDRARIVELVAARDEADGGRTMPQVPEVSLLPLAPRGLWPGTRVGAAEDDLGHPLAETPAELRGLQILLHRVVQQRRDCLVLVGAVLEGEARDAEQVGDVGNPSALPELPCMQPRSQSEGVLEAR